MYPPLHRFALVRTPAGKGRFPLPPKGAALPGPRLTRAMGRFCDNRRPAGPGEADRQDPRPDEGKVVRHTEDVATLDPHRQMDPVDLGEVRKRAAEGVFAVDPVRWDSSG